MDRHDAGESCNEDCETGRRSFLEQSLAVIATGAAVTATGAGRTAQAATSSTQGSPQASSQRPPQASPQESPQATPLASPGDASPPPVGSTLRFFPGFDAFRIDTGEAVINGVRGGKGPPVLLLQGWPQTHVEWHRLAPKLAQHFTVVATDLRGYGDSSKPADGENHAGYSKRSTAQDQVELMRKLGFERFMVVGHDRGGRVAHRMALDHPERVSRLALLDIAPTLRMYRDTSKEFASIYFHWFFLIQPAPIPETLFRGHEDFFLRNWAFRGMIPAVITDEAYAEYLRCFEDPATMHAMCEDYRAAATIDLEHDEADLDRTVQCPLLVLWGVQGAIGRWYDVVTAWQERATDVRGNALPGGHWLPEQVPEELYAELMAFLR